MTIAVHNLTCMNSCAGVLVSNAKCMTHEIYHCHMQAPQLNPYLLHPEPQFGRSPCQDVGDDGFGTLHVLLCVVHVGAMMPAIALHTRQGIFATKPCSLHAGLMHNISLKSKFLVCRLLDQGSSEVSANVACRYECTLKKWAQNQTLVIQ